MRIINFDCSTFCMYISLGARQFKNKNDTICRDCESVFCVMFLVLRHAVQRRFVVAFSHFYMALRDSSFPKAVRVSCSVCDRCRKEGLPWYVSVAFCDTVVRGRGNGGGSNCVPAQGERSGFLVRNGRRAITEHRRNVM